jgi:hypothetical protein
MMKREREECAIPLPDNAEIAQGCDIDGDVAVCQQKGLGDPVVPDVQDSTAGASEGGTGKSPSSRSGSDGAAAISASPTSPASSTTTEMPRWRSILSVVLACSSVVRIKLGLAEPSAASNCAASAMSSSGTST